ncbi:MAG TPA: helix-turn-helix domain-containing protein [Burkholderiaceae bacterium]
MRRQILLPSATLLPYVKNIMCGQLDDGPVQLPANADIQLLLYPQGGAATVHGDGSAQQLPPAFVLGGTLAPRLFRAQAHSCFLAVTFRAGGFQACFGPPAAQLREQVLAFDALVPASVCSALFDALQGAPTQAAQVAVCDSFLLRRLLASSGPSARPAFPDLRFEQLFVPAAKLADRLGVGPRQFERRFLQHYGMPLRDYRRLARFSASLAQLMAPAPPLLADLALHAGYTDQAHFGRDFKQLAGVAPAAFLRTHDETRQIWRLDGREAATYLD